MSGKFVMAIKTHTNFLVDSQPFHHILEITAPTGTIRNKHLTQHNNINTKKTILLETFVVMIVKHQS